MYNFTPMQIFMREMTERYIIEIEMVDDEGCHTEDEGRSHVLA